MRSCRFLILFLALVAIPVPATAEPPLDPPTVDDLYRVTHFEGGLVVCLGCDEPPFLAGLLKNDRTMVHGLDTNPAEIEQVRRFLHEKGIHGKVTVDLYDGKHLPYVDGMVNLIFVGDREEVPFEELNRVLAPEGKIAHPEGSSMTVTKKPRPENIDRWTHFLHDSGNNAVAEDEEVGPPKRLRWVAGPRWCRSHEFPSSVNAVVTDGKRIYTIFDEAPAGVYQDLPQDCKVVARDAFNGMLLWKVPLRKWQPEFGTGLGNRWNIHHTIPRRLIAQGNRVYVTLQFLDSPVSVLDAATGEVLTEALEGTKGTDEMVLCEGVLVTKTTRQRSVGATEKMGPDDLQDALVAVDIESNRPLWRKPNLSVIPYAMAAQGGCVVYHDTEKLVCLDLQSGEPLWSTPCPTGPTLGAVSTLVLQDGKVLFHGRGYPDGDQTKKQGFYLTVLSLDDGKQLWQRRGTRGQAAACTQPTDLFVIDGVVWLGGFLNGYDLDTGEVAETVTIDKLISPGHHYRCHRSKATDRYLIWPKRGAEFVDLEEGEHMRNDWLRAPCFTGATPANGLFYAPPSQCFCYPGVKVAGFLAMSSHKPSKLEPAGADRLQKGTVFDEVPEAAASPEVDWPMYRHDAKRSGSTPMDVDANVAPRWEISLACQGTQPLVVGDRLWVVEKEIHRLRCLNRKNGRPLWDFTASGKIDSAPTYDRGRLLFGCRDGSVYCLCAEDGKLVWRFQAAPHRREILSYGQLESLWPVQGSVLVEDGVVYFAAGRSSFLDGGILVYGLDAETGRVLHHHHLEGPWPDIQTETGTPFAMEGALPDLLVSDGQNLYMQRIKFDRKLNRLETIQESPLGELDMGANHLVATGGFLDDTGFDRLYWMHSHRWPGFYFSQYAPKSGQLVVFDEDTTYAVKYFYRRIQWSPAFYPDDQGYLLFADDNRNQPILEERGTPPRAIDWLPEEAASDKHRRGGRGVEKGTGYVREKPAKWQKMVPLRIRAMVLARDRLFAVGMPDVIDPKDPYASIEGRQGALLQVFSAKDGSLLHSLSLADAPAFDGLSAAHGALFLVTQNGKLICLKSDRN